MGLVARSVSISNLCEGDPISFDFGDWDTNTVRTGVPWLELLVPLLQTGREM